ncbi:MAG: Rrf2 family transcriptional regulator, partial [bacterium]|nr:Rrf2 family transcriptional regulator [bacterium]
MILTSQVETSLVIINYLKNQKDFVSLRRLSAEMKLPYRFVVKTAYRLRQKGLLTAREGRRGGYRLVDNWQSLSLYKLMRMFSEEGVWVKCE